MRSADTQEQDTGSAWLKRALTLPPLSFSLGPWGTGCYPSLLGGWHDGQLWLSVDLESPWRQASEHVCEGVSRSGTLGGRTHPECGWLGAWTE